MFIKTWSFLLGLHPGSASVTVSSGTVHHYAIINLKFQSFRLYSLKYIQYCWKFQRNVYLVLHNYSRPRKFKLLSLKYLLCKTELHSKLFKYTKIWIFMRNESLISKVSFSNRFHGNSVCTNRLWIELFTVEVAVSVHLASNNNPYQSYDYKHVKQYNDKCR
jgi:hypothetical protein